MNANAPILSPEDSSSDSTARKDVWPALASVYHEQGYDAGYHRGVNDTLATVLESAEDFARLHEGDIAATRRLLYAFSEFLEQRAGTRPRTVDQHFVDGLGI